MALPPRARFVFSHPAHLVAFGFGAGLAPFAPGSFGTLLAFPMWWTMRGFAGPLQVLAVVAVLFIVGIWLCDLTGRNLGIADHGGIVWDEAVAFMLVLALIPDEPRWQFAAYVLFRLFDILKPSPIREIDARIRGGLGVMLDDLLAAGYTLAVLALAKRLWF
ncbi:MAG: phosphatidylglycerophosphatase A [Betaproteobacteria bacterium]|nr:phosphatidylglycerophosphatase A [Betaproteobacteria bacterium]